MVETEVTSAEDVRVGDFIRIDYHGELRDVQIVGWRHLLDVDGDPDPLALVSMMASSHEYPVSKLYPGAPLMEGVEVAHVWRWEAPPPPKKTTTAKRTTTRKKTSKEA